MRILMVVLNAQPLGGLEICTRDVALSLRRLGHDVAVLSALEAPQAFPGWNDVPVHAIAPANSLLLRLHFRVWRWVLSRHLKRTWQQYDLVLIMHPYAANSASRAGVSRYWVWTYGIEVWDEWTPKLRSGLQNAQHIVAISSDTSMHIKQHLPQTSVSIIQPVVDTTRFVPTHSPHTSTPPFLLLTVGRLVSDEQYKGHEMVIRNLAPLQDRIGVPVEYWVVGDGDDRSRLERFARSYAVAESVRFWGRVPDDQLVAIYQKCDVFVMPSTREGFGIVYIEASACGKPVVGSNVGGAVDAIEDGITGFCIDPASDQALIEAVTRLLLDPKLAIRMGQVGRQRVEANFSLRALDGRLASLLESD